MTPFWSGFLGVVTGAIVFTLFDLLYYRKVSETYTKIGETIIGILENFGKRLREGKL